MRYGVAGLGRMGTAMSRRLRAGGHEVSGWNRSADYPQVEGVRYVNHPSDLIDSADIVVTSLFDEAAIQAVYLGRHGLLSRAAPGALFVDTSTVQPAVAPLLAAAAQKRGATFVDGPVLGTVAPATAGQLVLLVGGEVDTAKRASQLLKPLSRAQHHMGPLGSGYSAKLAINVVMVGYWASLGDALAIAAHNGLDRSALLDVIGDSPAALGQFAAKRGLLDGRDEAIGFTIDGCLKDVSTARQATDAPLAIVEAILDAVKAASASGWGQRDVASIALHAAHNHLQENASS